MVQILHHAVSFEKDYALHAVGNTKTLMSCTKMDFCHELTEAYKKVLALLFNRCLHPFYLDTSPGKDLSGMEELMESVRHAVEVNKETVVDMVRGPPQQRILRVRAT